MHPLARLLAQAIIIGWLAASVGAATGPNPLDGSNVLWSSPSRNSSGSMPLGNGDIGLNVWVQEDGDLFFYISKTDAWDEHARLLKLGRVQINLSPNPFEKGLPFHQELRLRQGEILIRAGQPESQVEVRVWVDANHPAIRVEVAGAQPLRLQASVEIWRKEARELLGEEAHGVDGFSKGTPPLVYPDVVLPDRPNRVIWYHRNEDSLWLTSLNHQGLHDLIGQSYDPLLNRTFGAAMVGEGLVQKDPQMLASPEPRRHFKLLICPLTAQSQTVEGWIKQLEDNLTALRALDWEQARSEHRQWWDSFWQRSWIRVTASTPAARSGGSLKSHQKTASEAQTNIASPEAMKTAAEARVVSQGYALQRFISACGGRGRYPIKFNGSIFTVDVPGRWDADYRRWGGCYWFQNTRLPYWPMLASGDFDLMQPLFGMYREALPLARARTQIYFDHGGACFPETMYFWGTYANGEFGYGWSREGEPFGRAANKYIRFYWCGGLELAAMMLDYYLHTQDQNFLMGTLLPMAEGILKFYSEHYPREPSGKILVVPAQSLETWHESVNPMPEVAGLHFVLSGLLALPKKTLEEGTRAAWKRLLDETPPLPLRETNNCLILSPAETFLDLQNMENPELYAIFPYRLFGVGKPGLEMARLTFAHRMFKGCHGWQQDDTQAAYLGLAGEARQYVVTRFSTKDTQSRFPAFWGPNFDWVPDQDHGGNAMRALQTMLLQTDGTKIILFPAWPKDWNVEFKLHAPFQTVVEGSYSNGKLDQLNVTPATRAKDVIKLE